MGSAVPAKLVLEDGRVFRGQGFGVAGTRLGEICFNTSMTGYQEVITDPSYRGQIVAMTYPLIGNYGVNPLDEESGEVQVRGFVVEELCEVPSNWRSRESLGAYLARSGVVGIQGVDTRALTAHLRERGAMKALLTTDDLPDDEAARRASEGPGTLGMDYVREVTTKESYRWDPDGTDSRAWAHRNPQDPDLVENDVGELFRPLEGVRHRIVAYDLGVKRNILRRLRQYGFEVEVVSARTSAADVLGRRPDGVFLSNGPGDPSALGYIHEEVSRLIGTVPVFGICLGHQVLGHAFGGKTFKLKFGHRGGNQPVKDLRSGRVAITSQNHGYAIDAESLPDAIEVTHINLNDGTVEGLRHREHPVFSVQYHPEASPGPHDARYFFAEFANLIDQTKNRG